MTPQGQLGTPPPATARVRALLVLLGVGGLFLLVAALLTGLLTGVFTTDRARSAEADGSDPTPAAPDGATSAEAALAGAPMLDLPPAAATPHTLTTRTAGPPIPLPQAGAGFPPTPEGALAQLAELMTVGMAGGDPQTWERAYDSLAQDGAAPATQTWTGRDLADLRRGAGMAATGPPRAGTTISWTPTSAMVKGTSRDGTYTVACVLGEFVAEHQGRVVNAGWGNCLPMRRVADQWRIASGPTAALAPSAWPGTGDAVAAGWREIQR